MIPVALRIKNFRSFRGEQVFQFPQKPGLYFMQGINALEPRLEANGAGKSTIWEALVWCFFNKLSNGLKAGDVCNWDCKGGVEVEFDFLVGLAELLTIRRTWGPITWKLIYGREEMGEVVDLTKEESNRALEELGLDFTPFLHCILMAQGHQMFLDLKSDQQAKLFSDVMGLDRWLDYSGKASQKATEQDRKSRELERRQSGLEGELTALGRQDFKQSIVDWEKEQGDKLRRLNKEYDRLLGLRKGAKQAMEQAQKREKEAREGLSKAQPEEGLAKILREIRDELAGKRAELTAEKQKQDVLHDQMDELAEYIRNGTDIPNCPTCQRPLNTEHARRELRKCEDALRSINALIAQMEKRIKEWTTRADGIDQQAEAERKILRAAQDALGDASRASSNARRELDLLERDLDRLEDDHERHQQEINPYEALQEKSRNDGYRLRDELDDVGALLDRSHERHSLLSFWVRGYKELRLSLIGEALTELEVEVNSSVDALGLVEWELNFKVDRETKSGSISRGFNCTVQSPQNPSPTPWEAWSGGESQRLRIAGTMGLSDLIRSRTGCGLALEVWDEPTAGLSQQGIRDLLAALALRAQREGRQIWIVDHRVHEFGGFAGGATITKTRKGSIITQY